ncbi:hypothetical protein [Brevibacterium salitolerans]|uniref:hypothetical protein n=1 Tax=Brevibacterium salitolerans TaxID=1403566 RepID=UPI0031D6BE7B
MLPRSSPDVPGRKQTKPRGQDPVPSWGRDLRRLLLLALVGALVATVLLGLARLGLLRDNSHEPVEGGPVWAGICAVFPALMFGFLVLDTDRPDLGFRSRGLASLMLLGTVAASLIHTALMMTWPLILGARAVPGTNAAELSSNFASILVVLVFVLAATAWFAVTILMMLTVTPRAIVAGAFWGVILAGLPVLAFLGEIFLFMLMGVRLFESPPTLTGLAVWSAAAVAGLGVLALVSALRGRPER